MQRARLIFAVSILIIVCACGGDNLSRGKAEKALEQNLPPRIAVFVENNQAPGLFTLNLSGLHLWDDDFSSLKQAGFIEGTYGGFTTNIKIMDKIKPYFIKSGNDGVFSAQFWNMEIARVSDVKVSSISKPADLFGKQVCEVHFTAQYSLTPVGEAIVHKPKLVRSGRAGFVLFDDGWKLDPSMSSMTDQ